MTPLVIGALLAVASLVWVIAPIFSEVPRADSRGRETTTADDEAAEAAIASARSRYMDRTSVLPPSRPKV